MSATVSVSPVGRLIASIIYAKGGGCDVWCALAGPDNAHERKRVMEVLGYDLPKSKCGLTMVLNHLVAEATGCELSEARYDAHTRDAVLEWIGIRD